MKYVYDNASAGRDRRFGLDLRMRLTRRKHNAVSRRIEKIFTEEPGADRPIEEFLAWSRRLGRELDRGGQLNQLRRRQLDERYGPPARRPQRAVFPTARTREHRPAETRRTNSSSSTSSADPGGDPDPDPPSPGRRRRRWRTRLALRSRARGAQAFIARAGR